MNINQVSFTYGRKFNLGDYNSAHVECTVSADLESGESEAVAIAKCAELAKAAVRDNAMPLFAKQTATAKEVFAGLPVELQNIILKGQ